jgi:hypothetical protein
VVELLLLKSQAMSELIEMSNKVSSILAKYPSEDQFFGTTRKVVLILGDSYGYIYEILTGKKFDWQKEPFWVPNVQEAENATFVFHNIDLKHDMESLIARTIFLRKIIFNRPIVAKVFLHEIYFDKFKQFKHICENCLGYLDCNFTLRICPNVEFILNHLPPVNLKRPKFFKFIDEQVKFEEIDLSLIDWGSYDYIKQGVSKIYNEFKEDIQDLAHSVCNYLAPEHAYNNTSINMQNETYLRLQITNELHYNRFDLLPSNFEEVFQRMNISDDTIKNKWTGVKEKQQHWNRNWEYLFMDHQRFDPQFNGTVSIIDNKNNYILSRKEWLMLQNVRDQISEYQAEYIVSPFENIITRKINDVVNKLISRMLTDHTAKFFKPLQKFDTWFELNVLNLEQHNNIPSVLQHLDYQLDKYFGEFISGLISIWFFNKRVPHDWEAQLTRFGMDDLNLVTGYYYGDLKTYLSKVFEFSEFINIVDYTVRDSFYHSVPKFVSQLKRRIPDFAREHDYFFHCFMGNLSQVFKGLKIMFELIERKSLSRPQNARYSLQLTKIKSESVTVLENEYQSKFMNATFDHELLNLWRRLKQKFLFVPDFEADFDYVMHPAFNTLVVNLDFVKYPKNLIDKLKVKKLSLLKHFITLRVQSLIRRESTKVQSVVTHIYGLFIQHFKTELDDWQTSQPYKRLDFLMYNYYEFAYFFRRIEMAFKITDLDFPEDDYNYLKSVQMQFDILQEAANNYSIKEKISTKSDWGLGMRIGQESYRSSAVSLSAPINFGVKTLKSAVEIPIASMSNVNFLLFLASVLLMKVKKIKWKF